MPDIDTVWPAGGLTGDWALAGPDLASGHDLVSAVTLSLYTDRQADPDDTIPDGTEDPRGWVGDADGDRPLGSKLWLRSRSVLTDKLLLTAADDIREALQWLLDDGVVSSIDVEVSRGGVRRLNAVVTLSRTGGQPVKLEFAWAWQGV